MNYDITECLEKIIINIQRHEDFIKIEPINKGWSNDKKYYIETVNAEKLLLRISDISEYDKKKAEFEAVKLVEKQGIPMTQPIEFGVCNDGKSTYSLLSWAEGEDAEAAIPKLSQKEQYELGIKAGELLKKIHSIPAPEGQEPWGQRFNKKVDYKIEKYKECDLKFFGDKKVLNYIEQNRHLLENRPQCFQHGDYHLGNMVVGSNGKLSVIDFNRFDYGDPWEEFNRIVWCAENSKYFATGRINGYFANDVPEEFFRLLALYISSNTLSSIYWAIPFGQGEVNTMMKQANNVLYWYEDMTNFVPKWYKECYHEK
jgi:aminoglycoside phosphotransferase (APT) family kinase protein